MDLRALVRLPLRMAPAERGAAPETAGEAVRLWCHVSQSVRVPALLDMLSQLKASRIVLTAARGVTLPEPLAERVVEYPRPLDLYQMVDRFIDEIDPTVTLFAGLDFPPSASAVCRDREIPMILYTESIARQTGLTRTFLELRRRSRLRRVDHILTTDANDIDALQRIGAAPDRIEVTRPLRQLFDPLPCNESERNDLAKLIGTRPVWVAAGVDMSEQAAVEEAHRAASRLSHRLLLIAVPRSAGDGVAMKQAFEARGWVVALRSEGTEPDPDIQVYVADADQEEGLWYRLAPICFLGSTLVSTAGGNDPGQPAALGSAIISGPFVGPHSETERRLREAGALRRATTGNELGAAVIDLLAPERAARMAHRAWEVSSEGSEVAGRIIDLIDGFVAGKDR